MEEVKIARAGLFPLRKLKINVNNKTYLLKGNEEILISLPTKEFEIELKMDWWHLIQRIKMTDKEKAIIIKYCFSDMYFFIALVLLFIVSILTFMQVIPINLLSILLLVFVLLQVYYLVFRPDKYFEVVKE